MEDGRYTNPLSVDDDDSDDEMMMITCTLIRSDPRRVRGRRGEGEGAAGARE